MSRYIWRSRTNLLYLMAFSMPIAFGVWVALFNNFAIEQVQLNGSHIGIIQSWREVPGFLAFGVVFILLFLREQSLALIALMLLGLGTALTGFLPSFSGMMISIMLMSIGFHYFETVKQSLALQWFSKEEAPVQLGRLLAIGSSASILAYGLVWLCINQWHLPMWMVYLIGGGITAILAVSIALIFPVYQVRVKQHKRLILRRRYWLYYALVFMGGARRQIFVVFAGLLMVERFGFAADAMALLFLANSLLNMMLAPSIGRLVSLWGERRALMVEYIGLILVFATYAFVQHVWMAVLLFVVDHLLFAMAIAQKTYFQKIADPADMASTAGVAFTINHIAAVLLPAMLGILWVISPSSVFLCGMIMAMISLLLSFWVPHQPRNGYEWVGVKRSC
jgi:predicted MFS family arabinose efflux permease